MSLFFVCVSCPPPAFNAVPSSSSPRLSAALGLVNANLHRSRITMSYQGTCWVTSSSFLNVSFFERSRILSLSSCPWCLGVFATSTPPCASRVRGLTHLNSDVRMSARVPYQHCTIRRAKFVRSMKETGLRYVWRGFHGGNLYFGLWPDF